MSFLDKVKEDFKKLADHLTGNASAVSYELSTLLHEVHDSTTKALGELEAQLANLAKDVEALKGNFPKVGVRAAERVVRETVLKEVTPAGTPAPTISSEAPKISDC
jgi:TolA-binding protein